MIFALLISSALACTNLIHKSEAEKIMRGEPGPYVTSCQGEDCLCYDSIDWEAAELVDETARGPAKWSAAVSVTECESEQECRTKMRETGFCPEGFAAFYREAVLSKYEAYCSKELPGEIEKTGRKVLGNSELKLAAKQTKKALEAQREAARKAAKAELRSTDVEKLTTVKELKAVVKKLMEAQGD